jgi:hypothetical protein
VGLPAIAQPSAQAKEADLRAAIIHRILSFTDWPQTEDAQVQICTLGDDDSIRSFKSLKSIKLRNQQELKIVDYKNRIVEATCSALIISKAHQTKLPDFNFTICNDCSTKKNASTVNLIRVNNQIRYNINLADAAKSGIRFQSDVIKWANKVVKPND